MDKYEGADLQTMSEAKWQLLTTSFKSSKPLEKVKACADLIKFTAPDICLFTEVAGYESLDNFNRYFLDSQFHVLHKESNSDRGIDLAALISKNIKLPYTYLIHKQKVFARGIMDIEVSIDNKKIHFLLAHLKSKLNTKGLDFEGRTQREKEVLELIKISKDILKNKNSEVIIAGDLNGIISKDTQDLELKHFAHKLGLEDVFEHLNYPFFDRGTYLYYNRKNNSDGVLMQLDYFLIQKHLAKYITPQTKVLDFCGKERTNFPKNLKEKMSHPSDHYPVYLELNISCLKG